MWISISKSGELKIIKLLNASENPGDHDEYLVASSLGKVGKGAGVLFFGMVLGIFFNFVGRVVIARFFTPEDYGLFNLFFTILSLFVSFGVLGLGSGISRFIGYYFGSGEKDKIKQVEGWGILIGLISGISFGIVLFFLAPLVGPIFSDNTVLVGYLRIAAFTLPFYVMLSSLMSIFRGHQRTKERILFYDLGRNITFLIFSFLVGILSLPFIGVIWSMFAATALMSILFFIYYMIKQKKLLKRMDVYLFNPVLGKQLLFFSLPLLFIDIMQYVLGWTDTLMIGYFLTESAVGFYEVAKPLSVFITVGLTVSGFIYGPLVASLYAQRKFNENKQIYATSTKWICFLTLPLAMILFFFSETIISTFFGVDYVSAAIPLKILSIAFFFNNMMGPDGSTLIAYGQTKFLMYATVLTAGINIILNLYLIQIYGIIGAALATGFSVVLINIFRILKLFSISGIHSLKTENLKPIVSTIVIGSFSVIVLTNLPIPQLFQVIIGFVLFSLLFLMMMLITHSISKQDIILLKLIENKLGINLSVLKRLLSRFM